MSELRVETLLMPAADLGPENPLPPLMTGRDLHVPEGPLPGIPDEMRRNITYGRVSSILPYTMQDGYNRDRRPCEFQVAVLENEILRATFLLEFGGRLWSLVHKPSGRELLDRNPVFQPANLALRNAWFSGGVEWNIGTIGHSPFTCSPLFAARVEGSEGMPILRLYEWERIRQVPFQIDAYLPDGSPVLFICVRITNPPPEDGRRQTEVPMYWWSNIAVPETESTRVIVPATSAYSFGYAGGGLARVEIPRVRGVDVSYPTNIGRAADFFFHIEDDTRRWITALDEEGRGLIQASTARLKGRKLFLWGTGEGGRRWQTFLAEPGHAYIEIQAGLARTQLEHLPMPTGTSWSWLEAYGLMEADPARVHGADWPAAVEDVGARLDVLISSQELEAELVHQRLWLDAAPAELIQRGSGWGALERLRRETIGEPPFAGDGLIFDDASLTSAQAPWVHVLEHGEFPDADPTVAPSGYVIQPAWRELLERSVQVDPEQGAEEATWFAWLHLGVMRYASGEVERAREAWERSMTVCANPWAARNLALVAWEVGRLDEATARYVQALQMAPTLLPLMIECGQKLIAMGRAQTWLDLLDVASADGQVQEMAGLRRAGRIRLLEGQAALATGDLDRVASLFDGTLVVDDLREGEVSLSQLWHDYHMQRLSRLEGVPVDDALEARVRREYPVPAFLDFRMSAER